MADDNNTKGPLPGLGGAAANQTAQKPGTAAANPAPAPAPADKPADQPADTGGVKVVMERDYWPKEQPQPEDGALVARENRVRAGETATLPSDEAMDVIEAGIGKRARGG